MMRVALASACATGAFCAVFATAVGVVADALTMGAVIAVSFASGFLGSLFARFVIGAGDR